MRKSSDRQEASGFLYKALKERFYGSRAEKIRYGHLKMCSEEFGITYGQLRQWVSRPTIPVCYFGFITLILGINEETLFSAGIDCSMQFRSPIGGAKKRLRFILSDDQFRVYASLKKEDVEHLILLDQTPPALSCVHSHTVGILKRLVRVTAAFCSSNYSFTICSNSDKGQVFKIGVAHSYFALAQERKLMTEILQNMEAK